MAAVTAVSAMAPLMRRRGDRVFMRWVPLEAVDVGCAPIPDWARVRHVAH
jgi:hypothetical protein